MSGFSCSPFFSPCVFSLAHSSSHTVSCIVCLHSSPRHVWWVSYEVGEKVSILPAAWTRAPREAFRQARQIKSLSLLKKASLDSPAMLSRQWMKTAASDAKCAPLTTTLSPCLPCCFISIAAAFWWHLLRGLSCARHCESRQQTASLSVQS